MTIGTNWLLLKLVATLPFLALNLSFSILSISFWSVIYNKLEYDNYIFQSEIAQLAKLWIS